MRSNRRKFLQTSATATAALMFSSLDKISSATQPSFTMNKNYELKIMATNWGFDGSTDAFCAKVKKEGYDGIEIWWPADNKKDELFAALKTHGLEVGFLCGGWQNDPKEHLEYYKKMVDAAAKQNIQRPLILTIIQAGTILVLMIIKNLLNIRWHWQKKRVLLYVMKPIVQGSYMLLLLQDNSWKSILI